MKKIFLYLFTFLIGAGFIIAGLYFYAKSQGGNLANLDFGGHVIEPNNAIKNTETEPTYVNAGKAPDLTGATQWYNTEPIALPALQGKVVLIHFWTYSSITSIRALPALSKWYTTYKDQGLEVIGIHTPQYAFEKVSNNLETAISRYHIPYPIAQDNNYKIWSAYGNQFWPSLYLVDKNGDIVYTYLGDGGYKKTEQAIRTVLGLEGNFEAPPSPESAQGVTPDLYLGLTRLKNFGGAETPSEQEQIFVFPAKLAKNKFALEGKWLFNQEGAKHTSGFGRIRINFSGSQAFMAAQSDESSTIKIYVDGQLQKGVTISNANLYPLYEGPFGTHTLEIEFLTDNTVVSTFTFK